MYQARFINPNIQFSEISFEIILEDDEGLLDEVRTSVRFESTVTSLELKEFANQFIENYNDQAEIIVEIDLPSDVELE